MGKRKFVPVKEAVALWKSGWCWRALGEKYNCSRDTVKNHVGKLRTAENNYLHCKNHRYCPLCYKDSYSYRKSERRQIKLFT